MGEMQEAAGPVFECPVCLCEVDSTEGVHTQCGHRFCRLCLSEWVLGTPLPGCPERCCPSDLTPTDVIAAFCTDADGGAERARRLEFELSMRHLRTRDGYRPCASEGCTNAIVWEGDCAEGVAPTGWACECGAPALCVRCGELWHPGLPECGGIPTARLRWAEWTVEGREAAGRLGPPLPPPTFRELVDKYGLGSGPRSAAALDVDALTDAIRHAAVAEGARLQFSDSRQSSIEQRRQLIGDERYKSEHCRHCPHCGRLVEKKRGCDNMLCGDDFYGNNEQRGCRLRFKWSEAPRYVPRIALPDETEAGAAGSAEEGVKLPPWLELAKWRGRHPGLTCSVCGADELVGPVLECINCKSFKVCLHCDLRGRTADHPEDHLFMLRFGHDEEAVLQAEALAVERTAERRAVAFAVAQGQAKQQWERNPCRRLWPLMVACALLAMQTIALAIPGILVGPQHLDCTGWFATDCACGALQVAHDVAWRGVVGVGGRLSVDCIPESFHERSNGNGVRLGLVRCVGRAERYKLYGRHEGNRTAEWMPVMSLSTDCGAGLCHLLGHDQDGHAEACWSARDSAGGCFVLGPGNSVVWKPNCGEGRVRREPGSVHCDEPRRVVWDSLGWIPVGQVSASAEWMSGSWGGLCSSIECEDLIDAAGYLGGDDARSAVRSLHRQAMCFSAAALTCVFIMQFPVILVALLHRGGRCSALRWSTEPLDPVPLPLPHIRTHAGPPPPLSPSAQEATSPAAARVVQDDGRELSASLDSVFPSSGGKASTGEREEDREDPLPAGASRVEEMGEEGEREVGSELQERQQRAPEEAPQPLAAQEGDAQVIVTSGGENRAEGAREEAEEHRRQRQVAAARMRTFNLELYWLLLVVSLAMNVSSVLTLERIKSVQICDGGQSFNDADLVRFGDLVWIHPVIALLQIWSPCIHTGVMTNVCLHLPDEE
eukprot:Hpha_TRINITY_DN2418_c0_g1::TRINITY_DN2418_c0_g1_i1::g.24482::m.24482